MSEPFDFEAFIKGAQLARRTVAVYRIDHRDEIGRLQEQHDAAPNDSGDEREGSGASERQALAKRIAALRAEMEASRTEFVLRTLTPDEFKQYREDDSMQIEDQLALQSVEPKLTAQQWRKIGAVIGFAQFKALADEATELVLSKVAVPDFSRSVSTTLNPPASSQS